MSIHNKIFKRFLLTVLPVSVVAILMVPGFLGPVSAQTPALKSAKSGKDIPITTTEPEPEIKGEISIINPKEILIKQFIQNNVLI